MENFPKTLFDHEKQTFDLLMSLQANAIDLSGLQVRMNELENEWSAIARFANQNHIPVLLYLEEEKHIDDNWDKLLKARAAMTEGQELDREDLEPSRKPEQAKTHSSVVSLVNSVLNSLPEDYISSNKHSSELFGKVYNLIVDGANNDWRRSYDLLRRSDPDIVITIEKLVRMMAAER